MSSNTSLAYKLYHTTARHFGNRRGISGIKPRDMSKTWWAWAAKFAAALYRKMERAARKCDDRSQNVTT